MIEAHVFLHTDKMIWLAGMLKLLKAGGERKETESSFSENFVTNL